MEIIDHEERDQSVIFITPRNKKLKRKMHQFKSNVYYFKYDNSKHYFTIEFDGQDFKYRTFKYLKGIFPDKLVWSELFAQLKELKERYKFKITKKGSIEVRENFSYTYGYRSFPDFNGVIVQVSDNLKLPKKFYDELLTLLTIGLQTELEIDDDPTIISIGHGPKWTGYGLRA